MNHPVEIRFQPTDAADLAQAQGRVVLLVGARGVQGAGLRRPLREQVDRALAAAAQKGRTTP